MSDLAPSRKKTSPPPRKTSAPSIQLHTTNHAKNTLRPQRPILHHRKAASTSVSISQPVPSSSINFGPRKKPTKAHANCTKDDDSLAMATSFLQFCASCERQITIPNNSVLYCSESCRRKDSNKPLSASINLAIPVMAPSPSSSPPTFPHTILPPMTPTERSSPRPITSLRIPSDFHDAKTDLDPSEWKPVIARRNGSCMSLTSSEAWQYLSHFHGGEESLLPSSPRRYDSAHRSTTSLSGLMNNSTMNTPPLTHTPTTEASSFNSNFDYMSYLHELAVARPLPPRHNPSYSGSAGASKGVELVIPHISPLPVQEGEPQPMIVVPVLDDKNLTTHSTADNQNHYGNDSHVNGEGAEKEDSEHLWAKTPGHTSPNRAVSSFTTVLHLSCTCPEGH